MSTTYTHYFVAFSGSLRKASYNTMALNACRQLAPAGIKIEHLSIADVPFYNADLHTDKFPPEVEKLVDAVVAADGVLFVSPEYNYSVPGVLKNMLDFLSRSPKKPFDMKPVAIMGASQGALGTARMQYHLRQVMVFLNAYAMNAPEVMIAKAAEKFDPQGQLTDEKTKEFIIKFLKSFADFSNRFKNK